jgi:uncharacterized membrane protein YphA (DoxX/SURF4 family)
MKLLKIIIIALNLFVGGFMIYGGIGKFKGETPSPDKIIEQVKNGQEVAPNETVLVIKNYIFGMKQTGYFWPFLGIMELLAGFLLVSQVFAKIGAFVSFPLTINIFLFHLYLEPHEVGELVLVTALLVANLHLLFAHYKDWKSLLYNKSILN